MTTNGFILSEVAKEIERREKLFRESATAIWISGDRLLYPPALNNFGIEPSQMLFVDVESQLELLWVLEQSVRCSSVTAVVAELTTLSFTNSRRLMLRSKESGVATYIHHLSATEQSSFSGSTNSLSGSTKWRVRATPKSKWELLPGVETASWEAQLLNG